MDIQKLIYNFIVNIIPVISALYVIMGVIVFKVRGENRTSFFTLLMIAASIYSFGYYLELNCIDYKTMLIVRNFEFFGAVFVPSLGILFVAEIVKVKIAAWSKALLLLASGILWITFITDPWHHLIYEKIKLIQLSGFGFVITTKGPSFYTLLFYTAFFIVFSSILIFKAYKKTKNVLSESNRRKSLHFLLLTFQLPWVSILFILFGFDEYIDPVPVTLMIMGTLFLINELNNNMFELQISRWNNTFLNIGEPAFLFDKNGELLCINKMADTLIDNDKEKFMGVARQLVDGKTVSFGKGENIRWFDVKKSVIDIKHNRTNYLLIDVTEKVKANIELKESEEKYRLLTENASDVIWILNVPKEKFIYVSPSILSLRGITPEEAMNETLEQALTPESLILARNEFQTYIDDYLKNKVSGDNFILEIQQPKKDEEIVWVEISTKLRTNSDGEIEIVGVSRNIDERKKTEEEIKRLNEFDQLTGVKNRRFYDNAIQEMNEEKYLPLSLIMVDLNGLKLTNDAFGHKSGDLLLEMVAEVLVKECREVDIVSRIGGDEFVLLLPNTDYEYASEIIESINVATNNQKINNIPLSLSIGFAIRESISEDMKEVFKRAEDEMYRNKLSESTSMRSSFIELILNTLYEKSNREMNHSKRVSDLCESIAFEMGFLKDEIKLIKTAGLMHDIGKIGIDEKILNKPDRLTEIEWKEIFKHPEIGYRILSSVIEFSRIAEVVLSHHEKWDGTGYPRALKGEDISIQARIIAIADAFDAMTNTRTYHNSKSIEAGLDEIRKNAGSQFDPKVAKIFVERVMGSEW